VNVLYQTAATGGRDGRSATLAGTFEVSLTTPARLGCNGANPEKLVYGRLCGLLRAISRKRVTASFDGGRISLDGGVMLLAAATGRHFWHR
jgi:hypothetical protein